LVLNEAAISPKKLLVAKKYISDSYSKSLMLAERIMHGFDTMLVDMDQFVTAV